MDARDGDRASLGPHVREQCLKTKEYTVDVDALNASILFERDIFYREVGVICRHSHDAGVEVRIVGNSKRGNTSIDGRHDASHSRARRRQ